MRTRASSAVWSEVWGFETMKDLELLHMKFCKQILNVRKNTANCMVLGELGRLKLEKYIESRMINFWCNLVHSGQDKLSGKVYSIMKILFEENIYQSPWIKKIKMTLDNIGMNMICGIHAKLPVVNGLKIQLNVVCSMYTCRTYPLLYLKILSPQLIEYLNKTYVLRNIWQIFPRKKE